MELSSRIDTDQLSKLTRKLELDSMRLFAVVCREGSYAKAARVEPLTASAISKRVSELERALGCTLLERNSYGVRPTVAGELVLAQWNEVAVLLGNLMSASDSMTQPDLVELSLVADTDAAQFLIFDCLAGLDALTDASKVAVNKVQLGWLPIEFERLGAHGAIWSSEPQKACDGERKKPTATFEKFQHARCFEFSAEVCVAVVREDHPLNAIGLVGEDDIADYEWVCSAGTEPHIRRRMADRTRAFSGKSAAKISRHSWSYQMTSTLEYLEMVPTGVVALLPTSVRHSMHRFPSLRCVTLTEDIGCMKFACALRDDAWLHSRVTLLERLMGGKLHETKLASGFDLPQRGGSVVLPTFSPPMPWLRNMQVDEPDNLALSSAFGA